LVFSPRCRFRCSPRFPDPLGQGTRCRSCHSRCRSGFGPFRAPHWRAASGR